MNRSLPLILFLVVFQVAGCSPAGTSPAPVSPPPAGTEGHAGHRAPTGDHAGHMEHMSPQGGHRHGLSATAGPGYTVADVEFMQMMMGHHAQAVTMSDMAASRGAGPEVTGMAQRIDISQRDEMALMVQWLRERGQQVPGQEQMDAMWMPGMVAPQDLARLGETRGVEFDRLYLTLMIEHHLGAIEMVDALYASPGAAQDPDLFRFITDVAADQLDEIAVMERLLDRLAPTPRSPSR